MANILVTGGAGYVGAVLVPKLMENGHKVKVIDLMLYGDDVFHDQKGEALTVIKGDIRDRELLERELPGTDVVIHLACISNDPSFDLDPALGKSINLDAFAPLVEISKENGVRRFINASSSSVYGIKEEPEVHERMILEPLTDYSKFKVECEQILLKHDSPEFVTVSIRPATVCGYSPRQRLDVVVNILVNHAFTNGKIRVFGGSQLRPNIHIDDMTDLYVLLCEIDQKLIQGEIFNAGFENLKVSDLAEMVKDHFGEDVTIYVEPTDDLRSYHISSRYLMEKLGFKPKRNVHQAIGEMKECFKQGKFPDSMNNSKYFNVKLMKEINLK